MARYTYTLGIIVVVLVFCGLVSAQEEPDTAFTRTIGGLHEDFGYSLEHTSDGGYIVSGITASFGAGGRDVWLIKLDAEGIERWDCTYGGSADDMGRYAMQTDDGGYIITGTTYSDGAGQGDLWVIKTDDQGQMQWNRTFGGSENDLGSCIQQTMDGGYIIVGRTASFGAGMFDSWLIKINAVGETQWTRTFGGAQNDYAYSVRQLADGDYVLAGYTESCGNGSADISLIRVDAGGNLEWSHTFGGAGADYGANIELTNDGGFILVGESHTYGLGDGDVWLVKTDSQGYYVWSQFFGGIGLDGAYPLIKTSDGGFAFGGWTTPSPGSETDMWLVKIDAEGNFLGENTVGGLESDRTLGVQESPLGGFLLLGYTNSAGNGDYDLGLLRLGQEESGVNSSIGIPPDQTRLLPTYPNPFNSSTRIAFSLAHPTNVQLNIFDSMGRRVAILAAGNYQAGEHQISLQADGLSSGVYFLRLYASEMVLTRSFTVIR